MVVEADESDRSFLMLTPTIAVVTNIDREHMDYYHDMDDVRACFTSFVNKVPFYGASVLCLDDPNVQAVIPDVERRRITYGLSAQADISAHSIRYDQNFGSVFTVWYGVDVVGDVSFAGAGTAQRLQRPGGDRSWFRVGRSLRSNRRSAGEFYRRRQTISVQRRRPAA